MRIAIVDDEAVFREEIEKAIVKCYGRADVTCYLYADGEELLKSVGFGQKFDAIFLDIEMKSKNGMATARDLRAGGITTPVIFITSHVELAMDGYEVQAYRFLGKPIDEDKLRNVLIDLENSLTKDNRITVRKDGEDICLNVDEIWNK